MWKLTRNPTAGFIPNIAQGRSDPGVLSRGERDILRGLDGFISSLRSNHVHVVAGDHTQELVTACEVLDIEPILLQ